MNCTQVSGFDEAITAKDAEVEELKAKVLELEGCEPVGSHPTPRYLVVCMARPVVSEERPVALPRLTHAERKPHH